MKIGNTINDALILLGVKAPTEEATPEDHEFGLRMLNRIVDQYSLQGKLITHTEAIRVKKPYSKCCEHKWKNPITIGHFRDVNMTPPINITEVYFYQDEVKYCLKSMTENQLCNNQTIGIPSRYHIQKTTENDLRIYFDCIPMENLELELMAQMPFNGSTYNGEAFKADDDIHWDYGYEKMILYRLAVELAPSYGVEAQPTIKQLAQEAEDIVKRYNSKPNILKLNRHWYDRRRCKRW